MNDKIVMHGREVPEEEIQACADEAEAGYDVDELRRGRRALRQDTMRQDLATELSDDETKWLDPDAG